MDVHEQQQPYQLRRVTTCAIRYSTSPRAIRTIKFTHRFVFFKNLVVMFILFDLKLHPVEFHATVDEHQHAQSVQRLLTLVQLSQCRRDCVISAQLLPAQCRQLATTAARFLPSQEILALYRFSGRVSEGTPATAQANPHGSGWTAQCVHYGFSILPG